NDEAILIDPGSNPHFPIVARKVSSIVKFKQIKYIIIHHQDPDLASNIPVFEKLIGNKDLKIITTERVSFLTSYYGYKTPHRLVEEGPLIFNKRRFEFIPTPYLHAPGAFTTYDPKNKILFSSDIFGSFSYDWDLYADKNYPELMEEFHNTYIPPGDILKNKMEELEEMEIDLIAPQHGSVIKKQFVAQNIYALKTMSTGGYIKK
ncbi:MAG: MBL fold metallo-hydrolase, partial [Candidatus Margulisbacteria bacterium]|nr:MBL fold metallo-hydrolase [Candidatus Margulisiibacteriota bacterium]